MLFLSFITASAESLTVGTAAEYRPFVYYDFDNNLTGLDIDIIDQIGEREGFTVQVLDIAFDGLIDSVSVGQIDLIAGGFSVTPERQENLLFSDTYYKNSAIFIASAQSSITENAALEDLLSLRFGVQRGSSFDQWIKTNLVAEGLLSTQNVFTYASVDSAAKALKNGMVDLVMLDKDSYEQTFKSSSYFKIIDENIGYEEYAFAAAPGAEALINKINQALKQMSEDGTLQQIIDKYINASGEEAEIIISRPSTIQDQVSDDILISRPGRNEDQSGGSIVREQVSAPTPTPIPPFDQPANCKNVMVYMSDVTYPDGTKVNPGTEFTKTWRIYNNGSCKWYEGYSIEFVDGDYMSGNSAIVPQLTIPGTTVDVPITLIAPQSDGQYTGYYQLRAPDGTFFGPKLTVTIIVTDEQVAAPAAGAPPLITRFQPNYYKGGKKFCPTVYWTVSDASEIRISINNKPVYRTQNGSGSVELCPGGGRGDYIYGLVAEGTKRASVVFTYTNTGE